MIDNVAMIFKIMIAWAHLRQEIWKAPELKLLSIPEVINQYLHHILQFIITIIITIIEGIVAVNLFLSSIISFLTALPLQPLWFTSHITLKRWSECIGNVCLIQPGPDALIMKTLDGMYRGRECLKEAFIRRVRARLVRLLIITSDTTPSHHLTHAGSKRKIFSDRSPCQTILPSISFFSD